MLRILKLRVRPIAIVVALVPVILGLASTGGSLAETTPATSDGPAPTSVTKPGTGKPAASGTDNQPAPATGETTSNRDPKQDDDAGQHEEKASQPTKDGSQNDGQLSVAAKKPERPPGLVVMTWPGAYSQAQDKAVIEPVEDSTGWTIERRKRLESAPKLEAVDVVELNQEELADGCRKGTLVRLKFLRGENDSLPTGGDSDDLLDLPAHGCGYPAFAWSLLVVANDEALKASAKRRYRRPARLSHVFDAKRYPGKRAFLAEPQRLLEMVLIADGVAREDVYALLATRSGRDKAFRLLDKMAPHITWVDSPKQALEAVDSGAATFAMAYNGRAFRRVIAGKLRAIWDGHVMSYTSWAVVASSNRQERAARFVRAVTEPERLAAQARLWPYGPMRRTAVRLAERHALLAIDLAPYLPTSPQRLQQGVFFDADFWAEHGERLEQRFADWRKGVPLGLRVPLPGQAPDEARTETVDSN